MPVYVRRIDPNYDERGEDIIDDNLYMYYTPVEFTRAKSKKIILSSHKINMNPIKLGYVNFSEFNCNLFTVKMFRVPARQWRIGLTGDNVRIVPSDPKNNRRDFARKVLRSKYFKKTACNNFPSFVKALGLVNRGEAESVAFSRNFAITNTGHLEFLQLKNPVGKLYKDEPQLAGDYMYLNQLLDKDMR
jgi:hypothetical protein